MNLSRALIVLVPIALLVAACGDDDNEAVTGPGNDTADSGRTIEVRMTENDFDPAALDVEQGETITFVFHNSGEIAHDAFIGDADAQADHEEEMRMADDMGHDTGDDALTVAPGFTGELTYTFDEAGSIEIGCHRPGHYASDMKIMVTVS